MKRLNQFRYLAGLCGLGLTCLTSATFASDEAVIDFETDEIVEVEALSPSEAEDNSEFLLLQANVQGVPYGTLGYSPVVAFTNAPVRVERLRFELGGPLCLGAQIYGVYAKTQPIQLNLQPLAQVAPATFAVPATGVYQVQFTASQTAIAPSTQCQLRIWAQMQGGSGGTIEPQEQYAGVLKYEGGYAEKLAVPVAAERVAKSFRVAVPSFCQGVELLEAGYTPNGGTWLSAGKAIGGSVFLVAGGQGANLSNVTVTLNGPAAAPCAIPVYVRYQ